MTSVFVLHHEYEWRGRDEVKLLGVYATSAAAEAAISRLAEQPGFRDRPDGFTIDSYALDEDHWREGFHQLVTILIPSRAVPPHYQVAHAVWRPGDLYRIGELDEPEQAAFATGDLVRCEERTLDGYAAQALVALERVRDDA